MRRALLLLSVLMTAMFVWGQDQQDQPSLADVVKQNPKKVHKVVTNEDIPSRAPEPEPAAEAKTPDAKTEVVTDATKPPLDDITPRPDDTADLKAARGRLAIARAGEANFAEQVKAAQAAVDSASSADRGTLESVLASKKTALEDSRNERLAAEKNLADITANGGKVPEPKPPAEKAPAQNQ